MHYTEDQKLALLAGISGTKDPVWDRMRPVIEKMADMGLVAVQEQRLANGTVNRFLLGLSKFGISEAMKVRDSTVST
jgi:hypothetical protein